MSPKLNHFCASPPIIHRNVQQFLNSDQSACAKKLAKTTVYPSFFTQTDWHANKRTYAGKITRATQVLTTIRKKVYDCNMQISSWPCSWPLTFNLSADSADYSCQLCVEIEFHATSLTLSYKLARHRRTDRRTDGWQCVLRHPRWRNA